MASQAPFNPLDKINLGASVANALLSSPAGPLPPSERFDGAGIYAIYYRGDFPAYKEIARLNRSEWDVPIYVGKAIPEGGRKGVFDPISTAGPVLHNRLSKHALSIKQASSTLKLDHFYCRYLILDDIWIPLGETLLIQKFAPLWNQSLDGFGNNDPGAGRYSGQRPAWDVLHPGRTWADKCKPNQRTKAELLTEVGQFLRALTEKKG